MTFGACEFVYDDAQHLVTHRASILLYVEIRLLLISHFAQTFNRIANTEIHFMKSAELSRNEPS